jgi:ferredoxin
MKINIDREKCIGCGTCANLCPECFEMKEGKSSAKDCKGNECDLMNVAESCPVEAISIIEEE